MEVQVTWSEIYINTCGIFFFKIHTLNTEAGFVDFLFHERLIHQIVLLFVASIFRLKKKCLIKKKHVTSRYFILLSFFGGNYRHKLSSTYTVMREINRNKMRENTSISIFIHLFIIISAIYIRIFFFLNLKKELLQQNTFQSLCAGCGWSHSSTGYRLHLWASSPVFQVLEITILYFCVAPFELDYVPSPCMLQGVNLPWDILVISRHFEPQRFKKNISHKTKYFHPPI